MILDKSRNQVNVKEFCMIRINHLKNSLINQRNKADNILIIIQNKEMYSYDTWTC